ncbi:hypothetical protein ACFRCW_37335 [Streptomyces sp. NPDC056653]|uniref:hypothetical protein n=1 Tax=Streptomyces sp. NPDC056653 TaxID=3345894 RepID=UPI00368E05CE
MSRLTALIALGTHAAMGERELGAHLGCPEGGPEERHPGLTVLNHAGWEMSTFASLCIISADRSASSPVGCTTAPRCG